MLGMLVVLHALWCHNSCADGGVLLLCFCLLWQLHWVLAGGMTVVHSSTLLLLVMP